MIRFKMRFTLIFIFAFFVALTIVIFFPTTDVSFISGLRNTSMATQKLYSSSERILAQEYFYVDVPVNNTPNLDFLKDNNTSLYINRLKTMNTACGTYFQNKTSVKLKRIQLDHILIDEKHKILFCYVPKVACTNWKRVFMILTGKAVNMADVINLPSYEIHARNLFTSLQNYTNSEVNHILRTYSKFVFVRNPFERLLSAYRNKLEQHYDSSKYFQARFGKLIVKNFRKNATNESLAKGDDVTFTEFVKYLLLSNSSLFNEHWQTVSELCHPCLVQYNFIGKYETMFQDSEVVLKHLNINISFPTLPKPSTTASNLKKYFITLDKELINKLHRVYDMDFRMFGYDLYQSLGWLPYENV